MSSRQTAQGPGQEESPEAAARAKPLFRQEALDYASTPAYGQVLLATPLPGIAMLAFCLVLTVGMVCLLGYGTYTKKAQVSGFLVPSNGLVRVVPSQSGVVAVSNVSEGQSVKRGDVLFVLTSERSSKDRDAAEQTISSLLQEKRRSLLSDMRRSHEQTSMRIESVRRRIGFLEREALGLDKQILLQRRRVELAQATAERYNDLQRSSFVSPIQVQDKQVELLDQEQRLADFQRAREATKREEAAAGSELETIKVQAERDDEALRRGVVSLDQEVAENDARREVAIKASNDGVVSSLLVYVGQAVVVNQTMAAIEPAGSKLEAELYLPSRSIGFVKPGMQVLLRYQAYSYQKFGHAMGSVKEVARSAARPEELLASGSSLPSPSTEPLYKVRVTLQRQSVDSAGQVLELRPGAAVDASILLETRRLYEWIIDPLTTLAGRA